MPDRARALIVYESLFENTEELAEAIYDSLRTTMLVTMARADHAPPVLPGNLDLLLVGAPTHAFGLSRRSARVSQSAQGSVVMPVELGMRDWLRQLRSPHGAVVAATFDTKVVRSHLPGSAARSAAKALNRRGYLLAADPAHFFLERAVGPFLPGELDRAITWAEELAALMPPSSGHGHTIHRRTA